MRSTTLHFRTRIGNRFPSGASWRAEGTNFSVFSRVAAGVELLLYENEESDIPFQVIPLDPDEQRTFFWWHVWVEALPAGIHYTWRVRRPDGSTHEILDPWARAVSDARWNRRQAISTGTCNLRGIVCDLRTGMEDGPRSSKSLEGAVIYEVHVGGFTKDPASGVEHPGTFSGLIEKIPYLQELGITHVELLPIMAFDRQDVPDGVAALGHPNYWGYSSYAFYAPHPGYCATPEPTREFRALVQALHAAGIGIILDVVFNHTSEGDASGPIIHFKALADDVFYHRDPHDRRRFRDYTGCGNTINCNHPLVTRFIVHCLEYWAGTMRVDGFRFDLASVFARGEDGAVLANPSLPWSIELSPMLIETPVIAEAWDAAGLYQVGSFPGLRWAEWNGRYRDVIRRFVRGDPGLLPLVATCLAGSSDLYGAQHRPPSSSINFITCHDGFTLWDLVSHNAKHNEENGEANRDGSDNNLSWNCGAEGETDDAAVLSLRQRQVRNFMAILFLSQGVPMILGGDEVLRTQRGNNNAWCQDNDLSWHGWCHADGHRDMFRFMRELIAFRRRHPCLMRRRFLTGRTEPGKPLPDVSWHGDELNKPPWVDPQARSLAFTLAGRTADEPDIHAIFNMSDDALTVPLPAIPGRCWHLALHSAAAPPDDIIEAERQEPVEVDTWIVASHSVTVFEARALP